MKNKLLKRIFLSLVIVTSLLSTNSYSQTVVCRKESISGFDEELHIGHSVCGTNTSQPAKAKIYLTVKDQYLYVQSNYLTSGFEHPTKIATTDIVDLETILYTIYDDVDYDRLASLIKNDIEFFVDTKLISNARHGSIDFTHANKVNIYCPDGEVRASVKIKNKAGGYDFGIKYNEQISTRIKDNNLKYIFTSIKEQRIDQKKLKVISLIENSSTKELIANKFSDKALSFDYSSAENFKKILLENRGNRNIILGHIEGGNFVTLDKSGKEIFKISVEEIQTYQKENKLALIILGCNSAENGAGSGALNKFNSIDVLHRLKTTENTDNVEQFLDSLAFGTLHFVLNETFFQVEGELVNSASSTLPERLEFEVYSKPKGEIKSIKTSSIGRVIFLGIGVSSLSDNTTLTDTSITNNQTENDLQPNNPDESNGRHTFLYIIIGIVVLIMGRYIYKSSKKN